MAHRTDFKDALFEQRKYRMQSNPDGTVTPIDETEYSQEGTRVGAKYFNETGEALNDLENPVFEDYTSTVAPDPETALGLIKSKASFKALFQNIKAALLGMVFKKNVLTSMEEVNANTDEDMVAGAMAVKELSRDLTWKQIGEYTGAVNINIPNGAKEIMIQMYDSSNPTQLFQEIVNFKEAKDTDVGNITLGNAAITAIYTINSSNRQIIQLLTFRILGSFDTPSWTDKKQTCHQTIWYR